MQFTDLGSLYLTPHPYLQDVWSHSITEANWQEAKAWADWGEIPVQPSTQAMQGPDSAPAKAARRKALPVKTGHSLTGQ